MAIIKGSVRVVKETGFRQQISKLGATKAVFFPFDLRRRASPGLVLEDGRGSFGEFPVKSCIMGDDDIRVSDKAFKGRGVDPDDFGFDPSWASPKASLP